MSSSGLPGTAMISAEIAGLERADLILPAEQFCAVHGAGLDGRQRRHSVFHHQHEFAGLRAVREWADVGAHGDGHAGGELPFEFAGVKVEQLVVRVRRLREWRRDRQSIRRW